MQLLQLTGPFSAGQSISIPAQSTYDYIHIGIQVRERQPIRYWTKSLQADLTINGKPFVVNETGILEFDGLAELAWIIEFNKDLPMTTIIDIAYRRQEN